MLRGLALPPNNRVRSYMTAAKPPPTALCNSRAPPAALGRQESVQRVVVRKSVARTLAVSWAPGRRGWTCVIVERRRSAGVHRLG